MGPAALTPPRSLDERARVLLRASDCLASLDPIDIEVTLIQSSDLTYLPTRSSSKRFSRWLRFKSTEVRSIDIFCVAVQTTDETLLTYLVIYVGMIVRRACTDAFEFGNANPDLRETLFLNLT